jgi:hypothetical protein
MITLQWLATRLTFYIAAAALGAIASMIGAGLYVSFFYVMFNG